jgi:hypothetical protein
MLKCIQKDENGIITLLIELNEYNEDGEVINILPEKEYSIDSLPKGSLTEKESQWVKKIHPEAQLVFLTE